VGELVKRTGDRLADKPELSRKRQWVHAHNMKLGGVAHAEAWMQNIMNSPSSTPEAKNRAWEIFCLLKPLRIALKERVGP
jgi:hypothetical protein